MHFRRFAHRLPLLLLIALLPLKLNAQGDAGTIAHGERKIAAGDVFEIFGVDGGEAGQFDWILTTDGSFVEASRETMFRTRLLREGTYILDGQFTVVVGTRRLHLTIDVGAPRTALPPDTPDMPEGQIVALDAPQLNETVRLHTESPIMGLTPSSAFTSPIAGDLDAGRDADGDGHPDNDNDLGDTLFATEHNPLLLWFASPAAHATIALSTDADDGTPVQQRVTVDVGAGAATPTSGSIDVGEEEEGTVSFAFPLDEGIDPATVLYQWYFGDGWQSLEDAPLHQYTRNDLYDVTVIVRELSTGQIIAQGETVVDVANAPVIVGSVSSSASASSTASSSTPQQPSGGGSFFWLFKILAVLLASAALGAGGVWGFRKFLHREGALQKALEAAESKFLKPVGAGDTLSTTDAPAALQLKRPAATPSAPIDVPAPSEPAPKNDAPPASTAQSLAPAPAPAWLQKGLETAASSSTTQEPPPPLPALIAPETPAQPFPPEPSSVTEDPASAQPAPLTEDDLLPPWLKEEGENGTPRRDSEQAPETAIGPEGPSRSEPEGSSEPKAGPEREETKGTEVGEVKEVGDVKEIPTSPQLSAVAPATPATLLPQPPSTVTAVSESVAQAPVQDAAPTEDIPVPDISVASTTPAPSASQDAEWLERERERKRRKRQRYRENVKKRKEESGKLKVEDGKNFPVSVQSAYASQDAGSKNHDVASGVPAMPTASNKPLVMDIPPANPTLKTPAPAPAPEDSVAFVIKAEGVEEKKTKTVQREPKEESKDQ